MTVVAIPDVELSGDQGVVEIKHTRALSYLRHLRILEGLADVEGKDFNVILSSYIDKIHERIVKFILPIGKPPRGSIKIYDPDNEMKCIELSRADFISIPKLRGKGGSVYLKIRKR